MAVTQWVSQWVSQWQGHLLSCQVTAKNKSERRKWNWDTLNWFAVIWCLWANEGNISISIFATSCWWREQGEKVHGKYFCSWSICAAAAGPDDPTGSQMMLCSDLPFTLFGVKCLSLQHIHIYAHVAGHIKQCNDPTRICTLLSTVIWQCCWNIFPNEIFMHKNMQGNMSSCPRWSDEPISGCLYQSNQVHNYKIAVHITWKCWQWLAKKVQTKMIHAKVLLAAKH